MAVKTFVILLFSFIFIFEDISSAPKNVTNMRVNENGTPKTQPSMMDVPSSTTEIVRCPRGQVLIMNKCRKTNRPPH